MALVSLGYFADESELAGRIAEELANHGITTLIGSLGGDREAVIQAWEMADLRLVLSPTSSFGSPVESLGRAFPDARTGLVIPPWRGASDDVTYIILGNRRLNIPSLAKSLNETVLGLSKGSTVRLGGTASNVYLFIAVQAGHWTPRSAIVIDWQSLRYPFASIKDQSLHLWSEIVNRWAAVFVHIQTDDAISVFEDALKVLDADSPQRGALLNNYGVLLAQRAIHRPMENALSLFEGAAKRFRDSSVNFRDVDRLLNEPVSMVNLASSYIDQGVLLGDWARIVEACRFCEIALRGSYVSPHVRLSAVRNLAIVARAPFTKDTEWGLRQAFHAANRALLSPNSSALERELASHLDKLVWPGGVTRNPRNETFFELLDLERRAADEVETGLRAVEPVSTAHEFQAVFRPEARKFHSSVEPESAVFAVARFRDEDSPTTLQLGKTYIFEAGLSTMLRGLSFFSCRR